MQGRVAVGHVRSGARALLHCQRCDPAFTLQTQGLGCLGEELVDAFGGLKEDSRYRCVCRRCGKAKPGSVACRIDVSQMFKRVSRGRARTSVRKMLRRVETRLEVSCGDGAA